MIQSAREKRSEFWRWLASGLVVCVAHGGAVAAMASWSSWENPDDPAAAMVVTLAPMPVARASIPIEIAPGPEQVEAAASAANPSEQVEDTPVERSEAKDVQKLPPDTEVVQNPEVVLPAQAPEPERRRPSPEIENMPSPVSTASQVVKADDAPVAAAPAQGQPRVGTSDAVPNWARQVVNRLERNKRYPAVALARGDRGTARLAFSLDREGRVLSSRIVRSSGSALLDQEALDLVGRSQPFPPAPAGISGEKIDLEIPVRFNIN